MNHHWLSDLWSVCHLLLEGMEAVLKQVNVRRINESQQGKSEASKNASTFLWGHLGEEQLADKNLASPKGDPHLGKLKS